MVTIREIAEACDVSVATVSNIINGKGKFSERTKERVLRAVEELQYTPNAMARMLKTKKSRSIGVIFEDMTIFSIPDIVDGITEYCQQRDYQILLENLRLFKRYEDTYYNQDFYYPEVKEAIDNLIYKQVEGIIYVTAHERVFSCIPDDLSIPAVMAYGYTGSPKIPSIVVDDVDGGRRAMELLYDKGHRKVGIITGKDDSIHAQARMLGAHGAMYEQNISFSSDCIKTGDWTRESGYACADDLIRQGVTAIFCMNDLMAGGVYDRLYEQGIEVGTKDGISVVGYDDRMASAYYRPPLTTVRLPLHDIGYMSGAALFTLLGEVQEENEDRDEITARCTVQGGGGKPLIYSVSCNLVLRESVASIQ